MNSLEIDNCKPVSMRLFGYLLRLDMCVGEGVKRESEVWGCEIIYMWHNVDVFILNFRPLIRS